VTDNRAKLKITFDFSRLHAAVKALGEAFLRFGETIQRPPTPPHGFRPDFDLACTVCCRGPEDHASAEPPADISWETFEPVSPRWRFFKRRSA
jgi:hypothetical protein